jgi:hypothetical protein
VIAALRNAYKADSPPETDAGEASSVSDEVEDDWPVAG